MSHFLNLAKLTPAAFDRVLVEPTLVGEVFAGAGCSALPGFDASADVHGEPYVDTLVDALADIDIDSVDWAEFDIEPDPRTRWLDAAYRSGSRVDYEFTSGEVFALSGTNLAAIAQDIPTDEAVARFLQIALAEGKVVIGGIG